MNADDFADAPGSDGTRFGRGFHRSNIATHEDRDVAIEERSEEHTSELQSHHDLVCRLLLEKKNIRKSDLREWTQRRNRRRSGRCWSPARPPARAVRSAACACGRSAAVRWGCGTARSGPGAW